MFDSVKEVLNKEITTSEVKKVLEMEIEIQKLKNLLEAEVKLKEFLLQEIDVKSIISKAAKPGTDQNGTENNKKPLLNDKPLLPAYDLGLISTLQKDHRELLFIYAGIMKNAENKKYELVGEQISLFNERFTEYFHIADKGLYGYLKAYIQLKQPKRKRAFSALSLEMKNLYLSIFYSLTQSPNMPFSEKTHDAFIQEYRSVGEQLRKRVEREEQVLFKMYEESHQAKDILSVAV